MARSREGGRFRDPAEPSEEPLGNGSIGFEDLNLFIAAFQSGDPIGDLSGDGSVGFEDLNLFITAFQSGCPYRGFRFAPTNPPPRAARGHSAP